MSTLGIAGFILMIAIVALLIWGKTAPAVVFTVLPIIVGFLVGFTPMEMADYIKQGISSVSTTAILFIFAVTFFGTMSDVGVFDVLVQKVVKSVGNNILLLLFATVLIAVVGHLDGSGATTLLITIPPLLPIYKRLRIRSVVLLGITTLTMGVMNIVPWGGPAVVLRQHWRWRLQLCGSMKSRPRFLASSSFLGSVSFLRLRKKRELPPYRP